MDLIFVEISMGQAVVVADDWRPGEPATILLRVETVNPPEMLAEDMEFLATEKAFDPTIAGGTVALSPTDAPRGSPRRRHTKEM